MSTALRSNEYVVITSIGGRTRSRVWDSRKPMALGHPMRWVLEKTPDGSFCVRDIAGGTGEIVAGGIRTFGQRELASRTAVPLPLGKRPQGAKAIQATVMLEAVRPIAPPFQQHDLKTLSDPQTFVFAGVRKTVISSAAMQSGYAAYAGTRPAFTVSPAADGYKIKPVMEHLTLTSSKGVSHPLTRKESVNLTRDELLNATISHGQYWWKFGLVSNPGVIPAAGDQPFLTEDNARFKKSASIALSLYLLFMLLLWMFPAAPKEDKPPETPPELVKFEMPKRDTIVQKRQKKYEAPEAPPAVAEAAVKTPEPAKVQDKKAEEDKPAPAKVADGHATPPKSATDKSKPAAGGVKAAQKTVKNVQKSTAQNANKAPVVVDSAAEVAAKARTKMLKDLLGGAAKGLVTDHKLENMAGKAGTKTASGALGDIGAADGAMSAPTDVRPGISGNAVKVSALGGRDGGSKDGSAVGYAGGEHAAVAGQGGSFVEMSPKGASVEEGLTKEEVGAVIHSHMGEIRYCHEASMLANPTVEGKLVLQFTINAGGIVESVGVASTTIPDEKLPECVVSKLRTWRFPHPKRGVKVAVAYPFLFKTLGRE